MYDACETLLYVLSAKRRMSWIDFKKTYDYLYTVHVLPTAPGERNINYERNEIARGLDALGHCELEFSKDAQNVFSGPPVLARLPQTGLPKATLVGARFPQTVRRLKQAAKTINRRIKIVVDKQGSGHMLEPFRVVIQAELAKEIADVGQSLGVKFENEPPAWSTMNFSASLGEYMATRQWSRKADLNWLRKDFNFDSLCYTRSKWEGGVRLSRYVDPVRNTNLYLLWKEDQMSEVDGDWGRYAALNEAGINVLVYDSQQFAFGVPRTLPLPRLIARGLTLCSGYLPSVIENGGVRFSNLDHCPTAVYRDVPPAIAQLAATKLGQTLLSCSFDVETGRVES